MECRDSAVTEIGDVMVVVVVDLAAEAIDIRVDSLGGFGVSLREEAKDMRRLT